MLSSTPQRIISNVSCKLMPVPPVTRHLGVHPVSWKISFSSLVSDKQAPANLMQRTIGLGEKCVKWKSVVCCLPVVRNFIPQMTFIGIVLRLLLLLSFAGLIIPSPATALLLNMRARASLVRALPGIPASTLQSPRRRVASESSRSEVRSYGQCNCFSAHKSQRSLDTTFNIDRFG